MKTFYVFRNKDSADAYVRALVEDGFQETADLNAADFILYDSESVGARRKVKEDFLKRNPGFIYPHTPMTCYIWDGIYDPLPVAANFVAGDGQRYCMATYRYPHRVEACGFPRCEVLPFQPAKGRDLLFVPARPRRDKGRQEKLDRVAFDFIKRHRDAFDNITICRLAGQFPECEDGFMGMNFLTTDPKGTASPAQDMIDRIDRADVVIAQHTPAALAVARGKPVIMYGYGTKLETLTGQAAKNYQQYKRIYDYPLTIEAMSIEDVHRVMQDSDISAEGWKRLHIGGNFDAGKFLSIVKEYV